MRGGEALLGHEVAGVGKMLVEIDLPLVNHPPRIVVQPVCVWGYVAELLGLRKKWGTR